MHALSYQLLFITQPSKYCPFFFTVPSHTRATCLCPQAELAMKKLSFGTKDHTFVNKKEGRSVEGRPTADNEEVAAKPRYLGLRTGAPHGPQTMPSAIDILMGPPPCDVPIGLHVSREKLASSARTTKRLYLCELDLIGAFRLYEWVDDEDNFI